MAEPEVKNSRVRAQGKIAGFPQRIVAARVFAAEGVSDGRTEHALDSLICAPSQLPPSE
jgi:hypothetical protein